jgi:hypothetical protein
MSDPSTPQKMQPPPEPFSDLPRPIPDLTALRAEFAKSRKTVDGLSTTEIPIPDESDHD